MEWREAGDGDVCCVSACGTLREPMHHVPDSSRRARGVELWAAMKSLGRSGVRELVDRTCELAEVICGKIACGGYEVFERCGDQSGAGVVWSAEKTREVIRRVQEEGTCWCGGTVWQREDGDED